MRRATAGEVNLHDAHVVGWVVAEEGLRVGVLRPRFVVVGATVHLAPVAGGDYEVEGQRDAVLLQRLSHAGVEEARVDSLFEGVLAGAVEDGVDDLVEDALLVEVGVAHGHLELLARYGKRGLLVEPEREARHGAYGVEALHAHECGVTQDFGLVATVLLVVDFAQCLHVVRHDALEVVERLVALQLVRGLVEAALHAFVEVLFAHLHHHARVLALQQ